MILLFCVFLYVPLELNKQLEQVHTLTDLHQVDHCLKARQYGKMFFVTSYGSLLCIF